MRLNPIAFDRPLYPDTGRGGLNSVYVWNTDRSRVRCWVYALSRNYRVDSAVDVESIVVSAMALVSMG